MIVIPRGNPFLTQPQRSGRVREIRDILQDVLAGYFQPADIARTEMPEIPDAVVRGQIVPPLIALTTMQAGATSHR